LTSVSVTAFLLFLAAPPVRRAHGNQATPSAPVVGVDVGIANFLNTGNGEHYSTFRSICHNVDRANRPDQQNVCCVVCGYSTHADMNAVINIEHRWGDNELRACKDRKAVKALLLQRHQDSPADHWHWQPAAKQ
jgi:transposase